MNMCYYKFKDKIWNWTNIFWIFQQKQYRRIVKSVILNLWLISAEKLISKQLRNLTKNRTNCAKWEFKLHGKLKKILIWFKIVMIEVILIVKIGWKLKEKNNQVTLTRNYIRKHY